MIGARSATMMRDAVIYSQRGRHFAVSDQIARNSGGKIPTIFSSSPGEVFAASTLNTASVNRIGFTFCLREILPHCIVKFL